MDSGSLDEGVEGGSIGLEDSSDIVVFLEPEAGRRRVENPIRPYFYINYGFCKAILEGGSNIFRRQAFGPGLLGIGRLRMYPEKELHKWVEFLNNKKAKTNYTY